MQDKIKLFKEDLQKAIQLFEQYEGNVAPKYSKAITKIRMMMSSTESIAVLQQKMVNYVENEMPYKLFYFLPIVNDLKRYILAVMSKPCYRIAGLLVEECITLHEENTKLRKENQEWQAKLSGALRTGFKDTQETIQKLQQTITSLELQLGAAKNQAKQAEEIHQTDMALSQTKICELEEEGQKQQDTIDILRQEKSALYANYLAKCEEVEALKRLLAEEKQKSQSNDNNAGNGSKRYPT